MNKDGKAISMIIDELQKAEVKHDNTGCSLFEWVSILTEEVGEFAQAINDKDYTNAETEAAQIGAVSMRILKYLIANRPDAATN